MAEIRGMGAHWFLYDISHEIYVRGFVMVCFVLVTSSVLVDWCDLFTHILQGYFTGTGAIIELPQCQSSKIEGYEIELIDWLYEISTKHISHVFLGK